MKQFECLGMQMHTGKENMKSKTEAMLFPKSLNGAKTLTEGNILPPKLPLPNTQFIQFTHSFKYFRSIITTKLNEDAEIKAQIQKAKSLMGATKHSSATNNNKLVIILTAPDRCRQRRQGGHSTPSLGIGIYLNLNHSLT